MAISLPTARYATDAAIGSFYEQLATRLQAIPDAQSVGFGDQLPPDFDSGCTGVLTEAATRAEMKNACVMTSRVAPGYFESLKIRLDGHDPTWAETDGGAGPAVITRALAERFWPGENAIGKGIRCCQAGTAYYRIVGVTEDVRGSGFDQPVTQAVFFPVVQLPDAPLEGKPRYMHVVVRSRSGNTSALTAAVRREITSFDAGIPIGNEQSLEQVVAKSMAKRTFTLTLLGLAAGMALLLSAIGLYGVVSYVVGQRRGEIGVRVALGASQSAVGRMIVMHSVRLAGIGVAVGIVGALATTRLLRSLLFEVQPTDPATLVAVSAVLVLIAALASWIPARRAMRVDPVEALRTD